MYDVDSQLLFPLDLQLFAEDGDDHPNDNNGADTGNGNDSSGEGRTFTQEELDNIIKGRIAKERKQWEKQLEDEKTEAEKLKDMTEKQKREYEASKRTADLDKREADLNRRELLANAKDILIKKGMSPDLAEFINLTDADSVNSSIEALAKAFQTDVQSGIEERIKGGKPIQKAPESENITIDSIKNMSTKEINENWDAIQEVLKNQKK